MQTHRLDYARLIIISAMLVYTLIFSWIAYTKFESFHSTEPPDMAAHIQAIWNTSHGRFLQQTVLYIGGLNHFYPILALFAPVLRLTHHVFALLFLYSLLLASGAAAVYLLARDRLGSRHWGLFLGFAYLLYPGLHYINLMDIKPIILSVPLLLFSFYFWQARHLRGFTMCLLLTSLVTEQVAPVITMFALLSWVRKRNMSWILLPLLIGIGTLVISMYVYVPFMSGAPYKHIRDHKFFSHVYLFSWRSYKYLFRFVGLAVPSLFSSWEPLILAIPYLFFGTVAKSIYSHYYFPLTAILFIALPFGIDRIRKWKALRAACSSPGRLMVVVGIALLGFYFLDPFLIRAKYRHPMTASDRAAWLLIRKIPQEASVACDCSLLPALALRKRLHEFSRIEDHGQEIEYLDVDYILIDPRRPHRIDRRQKDYADNAQALMAKTIRGRSRFEVIATEGIWVLFHRKGSSREWSKSRVPRCSPKDSVRSKIEHWPSRESGEAQPEAGDSERAGSTGAERIAGTALIGDLSDI